MIPQTFPSVLDSDNRTKMVIYMLSNVTGLIKWIDYIPVKSPASEGDLTLVNRYEANGFIYTTSLSDITNKQAWLDYIPVYIDGTATTSWSSDNDGYIPMSGLAALLLDFTSMTSLDPRITFSRTSNATVTNSFGNIGYAPHNLLTYSEQFDNAAWVKTTSTLTANATNAPNGTTTADLYVKNNGITTTGDLYRVVSGQTAIGTSYTLSYYVKAFGVQAVRILAGGSFSPNGNSRFDLTSGTVLAGTGTITSVGDGWYRCSIFITRTGSSDDTIYLSSINANGTTPTGNGVDGLYLWGAQLEIGSTATTYNPTTVKNLLGYTEAFDNAAWTKSNSFVQTNLLTYSEQFDNAAWTKSNVTVTANTDVAPNGTTTADTVTCTLATGSLNAVITSTVGITYTFSVYIKRKTGTGQIRLVDVNASETVVSVTNEWQRFNVTATANSTTGRAYIRLNTTSDEIYIWGAQLEIGSTAGDYRRTDAAALPVFYANHNGVVCAEKLVENTATAAHSFQLSTGTIGGVETLSIYAKAGERNWLAVQLGSGIVTYFNLSTGVVGNSSGGTNSITPAGNGYYRVSVTGTRTTNQNNIFYVAQANGSVSTIGDGTSGIYIFGVQLSDSASLDPYVLNAAAAPTAQAYYGARFDYDPVTLAPKGLLIEEQRVNSGLWSEDFSNAVWTATAATITTNTITAPNGTLTADTLLANGVAGSSHSTTQTFTFTAIPYTISVYAKAGTNNFVQLRFGLAAGAASCNFDLVNGTTQTPSASTITNVGNGWYRCTFTATPTAIASNFGYLVVTSLSSISAETNALTTSVYLWGAQLEAGVFATSYIPTAASAVTRAADVAVIQGSNFYSWYNQNEGSFYANYLTEFSGVTETTRYVLALDNSASKRVIYYGAGGDVASCFDGSTIITSAVDTTGVNAKLVSAYNPSNRYIVANNTAVSSGSVVGTYSYSSSLTIAATSQLCGWIKQISYYNTRLPSSTLQSLTS